MPTNRIVPALAVAALFPLMAWAQAGGPMPGPPAPPVPAAPPTEAEKTIDEAIAKIEALQSVRATIRQDVKMLGQQFRIEGQYLHAPGHKIYLLLKVVGLADTSGTMLQVSDGQVLWDYQEALDQPVIRKRELAPILAKLEGPDVDAELKEQVLAQLGFAGPAALLTGLRRACFFNQKEAAEIDGKKVWKIGGRWEDRTSLSSADQPPLPPTGPLPPYVPSLVYAWIGQEDGWPYRVELSGRVPGVMFQKNDIREIGPDGRPVGRPMTLPDQVPSEIVLTYSDVTLNPELDPQEFFYTPPPGERGRVVDETQTIVSGLDSLLAQRAAQKRAEAAKDDPELPGTLNVPPRPADVPEAPATPTGPTGAPATRRPE